MHLEAAAKLTVVGLPAVDCRFGGQYANLAPAVPLYTAKNAAANVECVASS